MDEEYGKVGGELWDSEHRSFGLTRDERLNKGNWEGREPTDRDDGDRKMGMKD